MEAGFTITGVEPLQQKLSTLRSRDSAKYMRKSMRIGVNPMRDAVREVAPFRTGFLRTKIIARPSRSIKGTIAYKITVGQAFYGRFIETGYIHAGKHKVHIGAHPFIQPTFEAMKSESASRVIDAFTNLVLAHMDAPASP